MIFFTKSFPKTQIIFIFFLFLFISCSSDKHETINNEKFIEIYARLLIISELDISKEYHDKLIAELYRDFKISAAEIDSTVAYLNANPELWVIILEKTRDKIQEIRKENLPEDIVPADLENIPRSPAARNVDKDETKIRRWRDSRSKDTKHPREQNKDKRE